MAWLGTNVEDLDVPEEWAATFKPVRPTFGELFNRLPFTFAGAGITARAFPSYLDALGRCAVVAQSNGVATDNAVLVLFQLRKTNSETQARYELRSPRAPLRIFNVDMFLWQYHLIAYDELHDSLVFYGGGALHEMVMIPVATAHVPATYTIRRIGEFRSAVYCWDPFRCVLWIQYHEACSPRRCFLEKFGLGAAHSSSTPLDITDAICLKDYESTVTTIWCVKHDLLVFLVYSFAEKRMRTVYSLVFYNPTQRLACYSRCVKSWDHVITKLNFMEYLVQSDGTMSLLHDRFLPLHKERCLRFQPSLFETVAPLAHLAAQVVRFHVPKQLHALLPQELQQLVSR